MNVSMYVDGLNLYNRMLRTEPGTKWLNLHALAQRLFPQDAIRRVNYFTAKIKPLDDPSAPQRQDFYLRALATVPEISILYGFFQVNKKWRRLQYPIKGLAESARVALPEEKGSDVNLAAHLIADGYSGRYEKAVVLTNDADLAEPIRLLREERGIPVALVYPTPRPAGKLVSVRPSELLRLSASTCRSSQFPVQMRDDKGVFHRPHGW